MSHYLYFDLETRPADTEDAHRRIAENVKPPAQMKKVKTIAVWERDQKPAAVAEAIARSSLDGAYGHICCIGFAFDDEEVSSLIGDDEPALIINFLRECQKHVDARRNIIPTVVGHNVVDFDIRFLWQRAIVLGIQMPGWFPRDPKPWGSDCFDTMTAWAGARKTISMDNLCFALGLEGKDDVDGSMVAQMWADGRHDEIAAYCAADVERTRNVHRRMRVAFGEAGLSPIPVKPKAVADA